MRTARGKEKKNIRSLLKSSQEKKEEKIQNEEKEDESPFIKV